MLSVNLPITATGRTGTVTFDGQNVTIKRSGFLAMATAGTGESESRLATSLPCSSRLPTQRRTASSNSPSAAASSAAASSGKATQDAMKDENSVVFWKRQQSGV